VDEDVSGKRKRDFDVRCVAWSRAHGSRPDKYPVGLFVAGESKSDPRNNPQFGEKWRDSCRCQVCALARFVRANVFQESSDMGELVASLQQLELMHIEADESLDGAERPRMLKEISEKMIANVKLESLARAMHAKINTTGKIGGEPAVKEMKHEVQVAASLEAIAGTLSV
jgi:hypothetical protein